MVVVSSGPLSLAAVAAEYSDAVPHYLTDYYRDGSAAILKTNATTTAVPTSGTFAMTKLYGTRAMIKVSNLYSNNTTLSVTGWGNPAVYTNTVAVPANVWITKVTASCTSFTGVREDYDGTVIQGYPFDWNIYQVARIAAVGASQTYWSQDVAFYHYSRNGSPPTSLTFSSQLYLPIESGYTYAVNDYDNLLPNPLGSQGLQTRVFTGASGDNLRISMLGVGCGKQITGKIQMQVYYEY